LKSDVVLEYGVPLLQDDFVISGSGLCGDQLLQVAYCVVGIAFDANLLAQSVIARHFEHSAKIINLDYLKNKLTET
jgi:hypothetical protein